VLLGEKKKGRYWGKSVSGTPECSAIEREHVAGDGEKKWATARGPRKGP